MKEVFEVASNTDDLVVLKVNADDPLVVAMNPYVSSDMAYISVTKGGNHVLTVIKKDGTHGTCFHWGDGGYTLISDGLEILKKNVIKFIEEHVNFSIVGTPTSCTMNYHTWYKGWQLTFERGSSRGHVWWHGSSPTDLSGAKEWSRKLFDRYGYKEPVWKEEIARNGITVWETKVFLK